MRFALLALLALITCLPVAAQGKNWIVDANGSGHFTDIQDAVNAAARGDWIHVLPGSYSSVQISKGLILTADQGAEIGNFMLGQPGSVQVSNLPSADLFVCAGFEISGPISVTGCAGRVHFQSSTTKLGFPWSLPSTITNSQATSFHTVSIHGASVTNSTTSFESCVLEGWMATGTGGVAWPGLTINSGKVTITGGSVLGQATMQNPFTGGGPYPSVGIAVLDGSVSITGGAKVEGGDQIVVVFGVANPARAMQINSTGNAVIDPSVTLLRGTSGKQPEFRVIPALVVAAPKAGAAIAARIDAPAGTAVGLLVSFAGRPAFSQFGTLWMSPSVLIPLGSGSTASTGDWSVSVPMNGTLHPMGSTFTLQGIVAGRAGLELTTPATITVM